MHLFDVKQTAILYLAVGYKSWQCIFLCWANYVEMYEL